MWAHGGIGGPRAAERGGGPTHYMGKTALPQLPQLHRMKGETMARKITDETRRHIRHYLRQGVTHRAIAARLDVSKGAVGRISAELATEAKERRRRSGALRVVPQPAPQPAAPQPAPPSPVDWATELPSAAWAWLEETAHAAAEDALAATVARLEELAAEGATWPTCESCGAPMAPEEES